MSTSSPLRIYTCTAHYTRANRPYLVDLLRPLLNERTLEQNRVIYGPVVDHYVLADSFDHADWAILPMAWNYYHRSGQLRQALDFIERAQRARKPVLTWVTGDFGAHVPGPERVGPWRSGLPEPRSGRSPWHSGLHPRSAC